MHTVDNLQANCYDIIAKEVLLWQDPANYSTAQSIRLTNR